MNRGVVLLVSCLVFLASAQAGNPNEGIARDAKANYEIVKTAREFILGGVGVAGTVSGEEVAFRQLLKQPEALMHCQRLLTEGSPAGQLYGLLGVRLLDQPTFEKALPNYRDSKVPVESVSGCIQFRATAAQIAKQIEKGDLR